MHPGGSYAGETSNHYGEVADSPDHREGQLGARRSLSKPGDVIERHEDRVHHDDEEDESECLLLERRHLLAGRAELSSAGRMASTAAALAVTTRRW